MCTPESEGREKVLSYLQCHKTGFVHSSLVHAFTMVVHSYLQMYRQVQRPKTNIKASGEKRLCTSSLINFHLYRYI